MAFVTAQLFLSVIFFGLASASRCVPATFQKPDLTGASILDIQAHEIHNYSAFSLSPGTNNAARYTIDFCNVTVTHTHSGWNDKIHTSIWLPLEGWNERFMALGGGGFVTGFGSIYLTQAVANGYATASTDGGVASGDIHSSIPTDLSWSLTSTGNLNMYLLDDYATRATNDMAVIGRQITESYYRKAASYSYFSGCSGGGRQGLVMAQKYPNAFDGILAIAPAINLQTFIPAGYWPNQVMRDTESYPAPCEVKAFKKAALKVCDKLDGVEDGIISQPDLCTVRAADFVGMKYTCDGIQKTFSASAAQVVQAAWSGSRSVSRKYGWHGLNKDTDIDSYYVSTSCSANGTCHSVGSDLFGNWFKYLVAKNTSFKVSQMSETEFFDRLHSSISEYSSLLGSNDPDLSGFKKTGGKMITWHGLADEAIPPNTTIQYYNEVLKADPGAHQYYRFFEAPGAAHCYGGKGPLPNDALSQLVEWVEKDHPPAVLHATRGSNNTSRDLCPYPLRQVYIGGDSRNATSFTCV